jgi:hypothetical protein
MRGATQTPFVRGSAFIIYETDKKLVAIIIIIIIIILNNIQKLSTLYTVHFLPLGVGCSLEAFTRR